MKKSLVIGVTGSIGSGKSVAARYLASLGAAYIDADAVNDSLLKGDHDVWKSVVGKFGGAVLDEENRIDKKKLANVVFFDSEKRSMLEAILHPLIAEHIKTEIDKLTSMEEPPAVIVVEIPLLVEADMLGLVDKVLVVTASDYHKLARTITKGMPARQALARLKSQTDDDERLRYADYAVQNDSSIEALHSELQMLWDELKSKRPGGRRRASGRS